jgi:hypothetical protein
MEPELLFFYFGSPTHLDYAVGSNLIRKGSKFRNHLSQQQMNQSPQFFQFWIANAMVNSSVHAYYIMLITFFFLKYILFFSLFRYVFVHFWDPNVNLCFIVVSNHRTVVIGVLEIVSKFQALLSIRYWDISFLV